MSHALWYPSLFWEMFSLSQVCQLRSLARVLSNLTRGAPYTMNIPSIIMWFSSSHYSGGRMCVNLKLWLSPSTILIWMTVLIVKHWSFKEGSDCDSEQEPQIFLQFLWLSSDSCIRFSVGDVGSHFPDSYTSLDTAPATTRKDWLNLDNSVIGVSDKVWSIQRDRGCQHTDSRGPKEDSENTRVLDFTFITHTT